MPHWRENLSDGSIYVGFPLRRTPTAAPLKAVITSDKMLVTDTHFWGGRTIPCERLQMQPDGTMAAADCRPCQEMLPFREHVYVAAIDANTKEHFIFECTANAAKAFHTYLEGNKGLRGCVFNATRPKAYRSGQVAIETNTLDLSKHHLPTAPNIRLALSIIWKVPLKDHEFKELTEGIERAAVPKEIADRMRNQPDNQPEPLDFAAAVDAIGANSPPKKVK